MSQECFVGIDVSKDTLHVATQPATRQRVFPNSEAGWAGLLAHLTTLQPALVVLEASGGYEMHVACFLAHEGLPVVIANPKHARDFAKSLGLLAKTDRLDAKMLARFAQAVRPEPRPLPDAETLALKALVARRSDLVAMRTAEENRLQAPLTEPVRDGIAEHIAWLDARIKDLDRELRERVRSNAAWHEKDQLLQSVPGIADTTSHKLLADLTELGDANRHEVANLVGVAPLNRDSGTLRGHQSTWGGRASVRCALYMATLSALRWNPDIRAFYQRLRAAGKPFKLAMTAAMRKLLLLLNSVLRRGTPWRPSSPQTA